MALACGEALGRVQVVVPLVEAVLAPERREVEVTVMHPGLSKNGNYYAPELLASMVPLLEGARAFADHEPGRPGGLPRSIRDLVGRYHSPQIDAGGSLRAVLRVVKGADWLWSLIQEAVEEGSDLLGISIDADGKTAPGVHQGRPVRIVEAIKKLNSVDVVSRASAGGKFERLLQADNQSWWDSVEPLNELGSRFQAHGLASGVDIGRQQRLVTCVDDVHDPVQMGPTIAAGIAGGQVFAGAYALGRMDNTGMGTDAQGAVLPQAPGAQAGVVPETGAALGRGLQEGEAGAVSGAGAVAARVQEAEGGTKPAESRLLEAVRAELAHERALRASEKLLGERLAAAGLPPAVTAKLRRRFEGRLVEAEALDAEIGDERNVLAELTEVGLIRGMGYEKTVRVGMSELERLQRAFDQMFDIYEGELRVPALTGIREAYVQATGDHQVTGVSQPGRLLEADITTASFSYLLGTSMNKRLLKDYQAWPSEWQKFCTITPIKDFKQQDRIRLGAFGSLSTVPEDTAYTTLTLSDVRATYTPAKRGNIVPVTRETIVNDDLYSIKQIPGKLAVAAAFTLAEFVYGFLTSTGNIYDANPLFTNGAPHNNSKVVTPGTPNTGVALSAANMQTLVTLMRRQTNLAGKPIGLKPRYLVVPPELEWTAMVVTKSAGAPGANFNDINPMLGYCEVLVVPQYSSVTMWNLVADPRVVDTIEIGFVGGQVNPILFVQDQPLFGNNFTNDVITYKVRHEYGGAVVDYRGFAQGNN